MAGKRETLKNPGGTFYTRRDDSGQFSEHDEKGSSLKSDRRVKAKTTAKKGQGDKGDQKKKTSSGAKKSGSSKKAASKTSSAKRKKSASKRPVKS
jgi:hypothetical protein